MTFLPIGKFPGGRVVRLSAGVPLWRMKGKNNSKLFLSEGDLSSTNVLCVFDEDNLKERLFSRSAAKSEEDKTVGPKLKYVQWNLVNVSVEMSVL